LLLLFYCPPLQAQTPPLFFSDGFENGLGGWDEVCDGLVTTADAHSGNSSLRLAFRDFSVQYAVHRVRAEEQPTGSFVFEFHVKLVRFTMGAVTIAALVFPTGSVAVVVSRDGRVGLAFDLFEPPTYGMLRLRMGEWQKIQIHMDYENERIRLYLNDELALEEGLRGRRPPLLELWLGTIWLGGAGNYGMMMECYFDDVLLGDESLVTPKPAITAILTTIAIPLVCIAAAITALVLIAKHRRIRRSAQVH